MTNAELLAKIREEIERRRLLLTQHSKLTYDLILEVFIKEYDDLLSFLSTLESEKPSEELEEEIKSFTEELECGTINLYHSMFGEEGNFDKFSWEDISAIIKDTANHFAKWGAEHLANSNDEIVINGHKVAYNKDKDAITMEEIPNELEEAARHSEILTYPMPEDGDIKKVFEVQEARFFHEIGFIAGAKWQKEQDEKEKADLFTIVALDAAQRAKEQMMKAAVEGEVVKDWDNNLSVKTATISGFKFGDEVRVIVLPKED